MKGSVSQAYPHLRYQLQMGCPKATQTSAQTAIHVGNPYIPHLRFNDLLEQLKEPRKTLYLLLPVYYTGYNSGSGSQVEETHRESYGSLGACSFRGTPLPAHQRVQHPESPPNHTVLESVQNPTSSLPLLSKGHVWGCKCQPSNHLVLRMTSPHPEAIQGLHLESPH